MNRCRTVLVLTVGGVLLAGCSLNPIDREFIKPMQKAHGIKAWNNKQALVFDLDVKFGGDDMIQGTFAFELHGPRAMLQTAEGVNCYFDGDDAWVTNGSDDASMMRFHVLTWPWFIYAPMALEGENVHVTDPMPRPFKDGEDAPSVRVTFDPGTGDTPDDWYIFYQDPATKLLAGQAYIVTFGKTVEEANKEPHAITYSEFVKAGGGMIPTLWHFWHWSETEGVYGEPIGTATVTNLRFFEPTADSFAVPADARRMPMPSS